MQALQSLIKRKTIPVIHIDNVIDGKMADKVSRALKRINPKNAQAVALLVNSPGGSPVQCDIISTKLRNYCKKNKLPLYTFADDIAASGGYFLLSIGDKVYVDENSLVGSIGVLFGVMGIKNILNEKKIEVREFSTQENLLENIVNPTSESITESQKLYIEDKLKQTHEKFIQHVESARGDQIKLSKEERNSKIYNADVFTGSQAVEYGLVDEIGNYQSVLAKLFPQAQLDFVTKKTLKERCSDKGIIFNIDLGFSKINESKMTQNMTNDFLNQFKN